MLFHDQELQDALEAWRKTSDPNARAEADNLNCEQRISARRQQVFEEYASGADDPRVLRKRQIDYFKEFVQVDVDTPHTFVADLSPVDVGAIDEMQRIVRLESLTIPIAQWGEPFERLVEAYRKGETPVVDGFMSVWNNLRDRRPAFATFKDQVLDELKDDDWPSLLRDRLGLAHYDCAAGPLPVALMEYSVDEVKNAASAAALPSSAITAPTVLDSGPWPYFFPSPPELPCGRTMALFEVADDSALLAEILHFRLSYRREHIARFGEVSRPLRSFAMAKLRNHHLMALQIASGRYDYGEEMPE